MQALAMKRTPSASLAGSHLLLKPLCLALVSALAPIMLPPLPAYAEACGVNMSAVESKITELEKTYSLVLSDISCEAPTIKAHQLMCDAVDTPRPGLWRMGRLDDLAYVYAYENATGNQADQNNPPRDSDFIAKRDSCTDAACLCSALRQHTDDSLGGLSPYAGP